LAFFMQN